MHMVTRPVALAGALELVEERADQHRAGGAERMAERDGATVDVHLLGLDAELLHGLSGTGANASLISQRSMSLDRHAGALEDLLRGRDGAGQHDHRLGADDDRGDDAGAGLLAELLHVALPRPAARRRTVDDAARVAGACARADGAHLGVAQQGQLDRRSRRPAPTAAAPIMPKEGSSRPSPSRVVSGRGNSSLLEHHLARWRDPSRRRGSR